MKTHTTLRIFWILLSIVLGFAATTTASSADNKIQDPLTEDRTSNILNTESPRERVPGDNEAVYGPIPKAEQIFHIEFLEIAPSPIEVDKYFFILLRGSIPPPTRRELHLGPAHLASATLSITISAILENGDKLEPRTYYRIPLRTAEHAEGAHLAIRNATGAYVDHMALEGRNDVLVDAWIPAIFVTTGMWTFEVVASLGCNWGEERRYLFALTLTQWLESNDRW
ncbi:hypothetical protein QBC47DRAFT_463182 [Echria macrotheca]|uniref:Uncharacterized protein n=1 Tax=Echria macrotheca TaxID=438768 RepID=A0AAJ0F3T8_9PEZI|nr:hypothetical protein QBC47DRAFT_463182 [Echria macrotheca]